MALQRIPVDFWFDPSCPASWMTSRWLVDVAASRPLDICWRVMSLSILNEGLEVDPEGDEHGYLWIPARVAAAVQTEHGHDALGRFHEALWSEAGSDWITAFEVALERAGLPLSLAVAGENEDYDDALRASHDEAIDLAGPGVGTPIIAVTDPDGERRAFFGPVIAEIPDVEAGLRLWDGTLLVTGVPGFREIKSS